MQTMTISSSTPFHPSIHPNASPIEGLRPELVCWPWVSLYPFFGMYGCNSAAAWPINLIVKCEIRIKIKYNKNDNAYDGNIKKDTSHHPKKARQNDRSHPKDAVADFKVTHGVCAIFMIISHSDWVSSAIAVDPIPFFLTISISQKASQPEIPGLRIFSAWLYSIFFHFLITIQMRRFVIRSNRWDVKKVSPDSVFSSGILRFMSRHRRYWRKSFQLNYLFAYFLKLTIGKISIASDASKGCWLGGVRITHHVAILVILKNNQHQRDKIC